MALGADVGGVIVALGKGGEDTSFFGNRPLETPAVEGMCQALAELTEEPFEGRVHIVSKRGITHFVDDRLHVLSYMEGWVTAVEGWARLTALIRESRTE